MKLPIDHFALIARFYDRIFGRPEHDPLPDMVAPAAGQRVLDVGGGTGRNAQGLIDLGATVIVCDRSMPMLREAHAKGLPAVLTSAGHLPFAAGSIPRVIVIDAFHHFVEPTPEVGQTLTVPELLRVLQPGGRLVVEEPDTARFGVKLIVWMERILMMGSRFLSRKALETWFTRAGASLITANDDGFSVQLVFTHDGSGPPADITNRMGS